jgi:gentisate 1,2-dioxygenase
MEPTLVVGEAVENWTGDARYFEYSRAANPIGSGHIPAMPMEQFPASRHQSVSTGIVPFDLSEPMGIVNGPATSPGLLASFVRIAPGESIDTAPVATSELYRVIAGEGVSIIDGRELAWSAGDFFVLPANSESMHTATADATLYWVTDEPLLRYLGVAPIARQFEATLFPAARVQAELDAIENSPHAIDRNRLAVLLNTVPADLTQTVTHVLWAMYGLLPVDAVQRPHRHQSVALDLVGRCEPGCFTLVGRSIDEQGEIVDPVRVDWEPDAAFVTPPGLWHAHHNESGAPAWIIPVQDAGLHTYLRSLDIRFAPPAHKS